MRVWTSLRAFLLALFRRSRVEDEMDEELREHIHRRAQDLERGGMTRAEAERRARVEFGGGEKYKEEIRAAMGAHFFDTFFQDLRFGLRTLRKSAGFTVVAVMTLALGVGATTAIFSVVYGIVFRPLPYANPERLVAVGTQSFNQADNEAPSSLPDVKDWQAQNTVFENLAAYGYNRYDLSEVQGGEGVRAAMVMPQFFPMLGVKPLLGRGLTAEDDRSRVTVLSYRLWQQAFHGEQDVIGRNLRLRDRDFEVIGVMPPSFRLPTPDVSLWLSFADIYATSGKPGVGDWIANRELRGYRVIGRLKDGISVPQAQAEMSAIEARLGQTFPSEDKGFWVQLVPLRTQVVGDVQNALLLFLGAVGFVLLIACINVGNLLLAKATIREREMAVRKALGGTAGRLIRQLLTESALLGILGGGLGALLAFWIVEAFLRLVPQSVPRLQDVRVDGTALIFALGVSLTASLLFGLAPALRVRRVELNDALREGGRGTAGGTRSRLRGLLVSGEIAAATVLVVGAALMLQSFVRLSLLKPGFPPDHLLTADVGASLDRYTQPWEQTAFFNQVLERIRALPGVLSAGACTSMPPETVQEADPFSIAGRTPVEADKSPVAWYLPATPGFLETLGLPLLAGRNFTEGDSGEAPQVAIINKQVASAYFERRDPLGEKIKFRGVERTIVGVVANTTYSGLGVPADFQIYVPYAQGTFPGMHIAIRAAGDAPSLAESVRAAVREVDPQARATRFSTMENLLSRSIVQPRFYTWLLGAFGFVALALSAIGIFGVMSYSVSQRTREIGMRMAVGAGRSDVLWLVVGHGLKLTLGGVVIGVAGALALTRFLSTMLYGVRPSDAATFAVVSLLLTMVALLACYVPARRAMRVDPLVALRHE